jgi:putative exporter of polyketide antibiotics
MTKRDTKSLRTAGISCIVGAAATTLGGIVVQGIVQPATTVSDHKWSYPWSSAALVPVSILWASLHVLVFVGLLGYARSGVAGPSRSARLGTALALVGTALLFVGEMASIPIRDQRTDDTGAVVVGAIFALAILLTAVGFLAAGIATLRARLWQGWRRFTPLTAGIVSCALLGLNATKALPTGVAIYGLCLLALGVALYTQPTPEPEERPVLAVQEQAA